MMNKSNVLILFGGMSSEYEISCMSAASILLHIDNEKYNSIKIGITPEGRWQLTDADAESIKNGTWLEHTGNLDVSFSMDPKKPGLIVVNEDKYSHINVDCVFPALHGENGEDGSVQGLFRLSQIPFVGCDIAASAVGFDKALTKNIVSKLKIPQADCRIILKDNSRTITEYCKEIEEYFKGRYPLYVKPSRGGSSLGISKVEKSENLLEAIELGFNYDKKIIVEEGITGRELEIAILGSEHPKASDIGEIVAEQDFYSYEAKYKDSRLNTRIAKDIRPNTKTAMQVAALRIYKNLECTGLARVDFFLKENGEFVFNEINTLPGFTPISMYPILWKNEGISYTELISILITDAIERRTAL